MVLDGNLADRGFSHRSAWQNSLDCKPQSLAPMGDYAPFDDMRAMSTEQSQKPMDIGIALNECCGIPATAYALAVIRPDGQVATYLSNGLKTQPKRLFTRAFNDEFLRSSGRPPYDIRPVAYEDYSDADMEDASLTRRFSTSSTSTYKKRTSHSSHDAFADSTSADESSPPSSRKRTKTHRHRATERAVPVIHTKQLALGDDEGRREFYTQCLKDMQQSGCKVLGKAWVKLLEPKKQSTYPYTKGEGGAPPWWPPTAGDGWIRHKEPDHLHKRERITLLIHILNVVVSQNPNKSAYLKTITVRKLEEVTKEAMSAWFGDKEKPKNAEKRVFLRDIFRVAAMDERYRRGELDATATIPIHPGSRIDHTLSDDDDSAPSPATHPLSPPLPTPSSLSPSTALSTSSPAEPNEYFPPLPRIPHRSYLPPTPDHDSTQSDYSDHAPPQQQQQQGYDARSSLHQQGYAPPMLPPTQEVSRRVWGAGPTSATGAGAGGEYMYAPWPTQTSGVGVGVQYAFPLSTTTATLPPAQQQGGGVLPPPFLPPLGGQGGYEDMSVGVGVVGGQRGFDGVGVGMGVGVGGMMRGFEWEGGFGEMKVEGGVGNA